MPKRAARGIELLADPTRRRVIALIAMGVRHPADIASELRLSRPATSRQLRLLTEAGLLRWTWSRLDRRSRLYVIDPGMLAPITAWLAGVDIARTRAFYSPYWSTPVTRAGNLRDDSGARGGGSA